MVGGGGGGCGGCGAVFEGFEAGELESGIERSSGESKESVAAFG